MKKKKNKQNDGKFDTFKTFKNQRTILVYPMLYTQYIESNPTYILSRAIVPEVMQIMIKFVQRLLHSCNAV